MSLIDRVIEEIRKDFAMGDLTALDELLTFVPRENLIGYLPEEEWSNFENEYCCDNCGGNEWMLLAQESVAVKQGGKAYCECLRCGSTTHL